MAKTNLLNTRTTNFLELVGNGRIYRVPAFQRDYSWEVEQWEDLWNDILELRGRPEERHYMGALVVESKSDREFVVIDGQQRLATLSILALAVIQRLGVLAGSGVDAEGNRARAAALRGRFIGEKDPASLVESSKLFLNETDDGFYQDYLVQLRKPLNPRGLSRSNALLWGCFEYYAARMDEIPEFRANGEALAELLSETVARQLLFILINVDDDLNAYTVFETLNARGLELTTTDLLKNYLFSRIKVPSDAAVLQRRWRALVGTVRTERFPEFLRYHLLTEQPKVRSQRLFKIVRDRVRTSAQVFELMSDLERRAELFAALSDPSHAYWAELESARPHIRELTLFRVRQMTPLLLAAWERFSKEDFVRVLKLVSVISFRYSVVSSLNTNALEPAYHLSAKAVLGGEAKNPSQVFDRVRAIYIDDAKLEQDFALLTLDTGNNRRKLSKYILARLEEDASGRSCDPETDPATIEHVLPENPLEEWTASIPREKWDESVYRLGNMALLEPSSNRDVGNAPYPEKSLAYGKSTYDTTKHIVQIAPETWTLPHIDKRQQELAKRAVHIWRSDFA